MDGINEASGIPRFCNAYEMTSTMECFSAAGYEKIDDSYFLLSLYS
jgi:hypothetical protein